MPKVDNAITGAFRVAIRAAIEAMGKSVFERTSFFAKGKVESSYDLDKAA